MYLVSEFRILIPLSMLSLMYGRYTKPPSWRNLAKRPTLQRGSRDAAECADAGCTGATGTRGYGGCAGAAVLGCGRRQEPTAQNSGRAFALDGAWGAKVGLGPPKTDAIFIPGKIS